MTRPGQQEAFALDAVLRFFTNEAARRTWLIYLARFSRAARVANLAITLPSKSYRIGPIWAKLSLP